MKRIGGCVTFDVGVELPDGEAYALIPELVKAGRIPQFEVDAAVDEGRLETLVDVARQRLLHLAVVVDHRLRAEERIFFKHRGLFYVVARRGDGPRDVHIGTAVWVWPLARLQGGGAGAARLLFGGGRHRATCRGAEAASALASGGTARLTQRSPRHKNAAVEFEAA